MGYIERNLVPGETLVYRTWSHWIVMFWPLLGGLVLGFFGFVLFAGGWLATRKGSSYQGAIVEGAIALVAAVTLVGGGIIRRAATEVPVSKQPLIAYDASPSRAASLGATQRVNSLTIV